MIDQHGWSSDKWDALSFEAKAMTIASLEYWSEEREKESKKRNRKKRRG